MTDNIRFRQNQKPWKRSISPKLVRHVWSVMTQMQHNRERLIVRDIQVRAGVSSTSIVTSAISVLESLGYLEHERSLSGAIRIVVGCI